MLCFISSPSLHLSFRSYSPQDLQSSLKAVSFLIKCSYSSFQGKYILPDSVQTAPAGFLWQDHRIIERRNMAWLIWHLHSLKKKTMLHINVSPFPSYWEVFLWKQIRINYHLGPTRCLENISSSGLLKLKSFLKERLPGLPSRSYAL